MKLIKQLIEKKLEKFDEDTLNNVYKYWNFYQAYNLAKIVMKNKFDENDRRKNSLFISGLRNDAKANMVFTYLAKNDRIVINDFFNKFKELKVRQDTYGSLSDETSFGVAVFELEND